MVNEAQDGNGRDKAPGGERPGPGGYRPPPPDATGSEARFLAELRAAGAVVDVHLSGGTTLRGVVQDFSAETIEIASGETQVVLRKADVRYIVAVRP